MTDIGKEEYLGDGLYASFDGFMFTLRAPREHGDHWVVLEPGVMKAFDEYRERTLRAAIHHLRPRIEALEAVLREDINILLNLLNPLHSELDKQSYDEKLSQNFDAPPDAEYNVNITAQMERDLTQAVLILESRRAALAPEQDK